MLLFITAFMGLVYVYTGFRCLHFMASPMWMKIILGILLLPGIFDITAVLVWGAKMPLWVLHLLSWTGLTLIYLGMATFLLDVIRWIYHPIPWLTDGVVLVAIILAGLAIYHAKQLPVVHEITVRSSRLPENWQALKIVHLTDLHIGQGFDKGRLDKIIQQTNALKPDVIFITGDSIDQRVRTLGQEMKALTQLKAPVYMVLGNHEYYHGPEEWRQTFQKMGIPVLTNQAVILDNQGQKYVVGGADFGGWLKEEQVPNGLKKTFTGTDDTLPRLLLVHYPVVFDEAIKQNVLLQLSGHTHGGMTPPISWATALFNKGYVRGLYHKAGAHLYVSDGAGLWTGMPARLGSSNEIAVIHWVKE